MPIYTYTTLLARKEGFPRDETGTPYLPGQVLHEAIEAAAIFYFIKKDKALEHQVRRYLMGTDIRVDEIAQQVRQRVYDRYPWLKEIQLPERMPLTEGTIERTYVEVWDLRQWDIVDDFVTEGFKGVIPVQFEAPWGQKLCYAFQSYAEALARMEKEMLKDHPLATEFYPQLINDLRQEGCPARLGYWTDTPYGGHLLFFWRIPEIRKHILKQLKVDIRPTQIIFLPREMATAGWAWYRPE